MELDKAKDETPARTTNIRDPTGDAISIESHLLNLCNRVSACFICL